MTTTIPQENLFLAINESLKPVLVSTCSTQEQMVHLDRLLDRCDQVTYPIRNFLEAEMPEYDYQYNDVVGFDEGKWCAEFIIALERNLIFQESDVEFLKELGRPTWILRVLVSLVYPVFILSIERWELSSTRENWVECFSDNERFPQFEGPILQIRNYLESQNLAEIPAPLLSEVPQSEQLLANDQQWTLGQLLFNEVLEDEVETLTVNPNTR